LSVEPVGEGGLVADLFRRESARLCAALVRILGVGNLDLAEDVVQDVLVRALETWKWGRLPDNPAAWLMRAAKNRALDVIRREQNARRFAPEVSRLFESGAALEAGLDELLFASEIRDDELRMMFTCCHPAIPPEAQVALVLKTLCGFGVSEIAHAFLDSEAAVEKRLGRARAAIGRAGALYPVATAADVGERRGAVLAALYLLFNEGYHGSHPERSVREELCFEAMRLAALVADHPAGARPDTFALQALFSLHAARLPARLDADGLFVLLEAQDRARWDAHLIAHGFERLERSAAGGEITPYHLEAGIAAHHCVAPDLEHTDWRGIRQLYDKLLELRPSPVVALNRAIAVAQIEGPEAGLQAIDAIADRARLERYLFLPVARGELLRRAGRLDEAEVQLARALRMARNAAEARFIDERLRLCRQPG
jgi:RNA polymerase sigma-70 factor (ECF subfamily)